MIIELNTTILSPARRPIPVQSDCDISEVENVDFIFYKPSVKKFAEGRGKAFLTDLRVRLLFYLSPATRATLTLSSDVLPLQRPFPVPRSLLSFLRRVTFRCLGFLEWSA